MNRKLKQLHKHLNKVNQLRRQALDDAHADGQNTNRKSLRAELDAAARLAALRGADRVNVRTPEQIAMDELDAMFTDKPRHTDGNTTSS